MVRLLGRYAEWESPESIKEIHELASELAGHTLLHVYSGALGDELANILDRLGALLNDLGLHAQHSQIIGPESFFDVARTVEKGLLGNDALLTPDMAKEYAEVLKENARRLYLSADTVVIHNVSPFGLVRHRRSASPWVWRCHLNVSRSLPEPWQFISGDVALYDAVIFSHASFVHPGPSSPFIMAPSIDPLSQEERELSAGEQESFLSRLGVPKGRPIILQLCVAEDPSGLTSLIRLLPAIRRHAPCVLVIAAVMTGSLREDWSALGRVQDLVRGDPDIQVVALRPGPEMDALQQAAAVVVQTAPGLRIDIGVLECLWRRKPVILRRELVQSLQLQNGVTGFEAQSVEAMARLLRQVLTNPVEAQKVGDSAREHVRRNYLITRHLKDYLSLIRTLKERRP